ncbi:unnamed protein product [Orchesella dallaii]|uniref:RRM domain-containing protein n=1 Tax=Orchesella dallaii TaxID=48710 RepID=A0ABP1S040_9HEXA
MDTYVLKCTLCHGHDTFDTRKEWLSHLLQPSHQSKARKEICRWGQPERDCALVAYSSLPIASLELLQYFSKGSMDLVTDFVWFHNHPKVGFIKFENKQKVEEILLSLSILGVPEIRVNNQLIHIKRAGECHQLEWENSIKQESESGPLAQEGITQQASQLNEAEFLFTQYNSIRQEIEISDEELIIASNLMKMLQIQVSTRFPDSQLVWYRNWYLNLKSNATDELVFFVDQKGTYGKNSTDIVITHKDQFPFLEKETPNELFLNIPHLPITAVTQADDDVIKYGQQFLCKTSNLLFTVARTPGSRLAESQACRLVAYYCSFDSRVKPLITVIRYWAKVNGIQLADPNERSVRRAPDPAALDWLVIFFLCRKNILLTPRNVTKGSHPKLKLEGIDIGFSEDPRFARRFSDDHEHENELHWFNVFKLAKGFFMFYAKELKLETGKQIVLNMRDGEAFGLNQLLRDDWHMSTNLTLSEIKLARAGKMRNGKGGGKIIQLLHPLHLKHGFSFCPDNFVSSVCPVMKITGDKLERALALYKHDGQEFDIKSILRVEMRKAEGADNR